MRSKPHRMKTLAFQVCAILLLATAVAAVRLPAKPELSSLISSVRTFQPKQLKSSVLYDVSRPGQEIQCLTKTLIHEDIQPAPAGQNVFWVPHSLIIHDGVRCGTGRRDEYMILVKGDDVKLEGRAKEKGLQEVFNVLDANGKGLSILEILDAVSPVYVGVEMSADRQCGGRVVYPRGSVFLFISSPLHSINLGFAFFPQSSVGMVSVLVNRKYCAYVDDTSKFKGTLPSISTSATSTPRPENAYGLDPPVLQKALSSPSPSHAPGYPQVNHSTMPTWTPYTTNASSFATQSPIPNIGENTGVYNSHAPAMPSQSPVHYSYNSSFSSEPWTPHSPGQSSSVPAADLTPSWLKNSCFPNMATVELESGRIVPISKLTVGDRVRTGSNSFSHVFMFTHKNNVGVNEFLRIGVTSGVFVELSAGHYIAANGVLTAAQNVKAGDKIGLSYGVEDIVVDVKRVWREGLHNPQTMDGNIVVNGIITSTYTEAIVPPVATALLSPLRSLYYFGIWEALLEDVLHLSDHGLLSYLPKSFSASQNKF